MSDLRIALIAEGKTDLVVIEAALKAILQAPFVLKLIQPEASSRELGEGWGGVAKWCHQSVQRGEGVLHDDPTLFMYDFYIVHLDADVAGMTYANSGLEALALQNNWGPLPCQMPCPNAQDSVTALRTVLLSWLGNVVPTNKTVICIPSKAIESWLAAAVLPAGAAVLKELECHLNMKSVLAHLAKGSKIKSRLDYIAKAPLLQARWAQVCLLCAQADIFDQDVRAV
ncbi:hypothetical protein [Pseudomonas fildesensis]|uniref:DUF4276 family protein n=1 Tax=Pseudomonas fildesensis TaxID=1674920 RepID=A0A0J8G1M6_9PSED|nr:hypothetical protein [Pseudomonas fildesensis]KMT56395.1 hypothetical protein ACR52_08420 [Pseudomonas fildesensis]